MTDAAEGAAESLVAAEAGSEEALSGGPPTSLQAAFQAFLKEKRERRKKRAPQPDPGLLTRSPTDPSRVAYVRGLFLERIRSYIGVPYARRHHQTEECTCEGCAEAGRQLALDPLFLDCCGLVRKAVRDLADVLGFRLGAGNQAYQYDTLPMRVESHTQLEPGDLIFYSGVYHDPSHKRYAFDMTHVEVFVGGETGEATIGARWRQKWVQEFPSYQFVSARWSLLQHHYVKIDTWLQGVCEPLHPDLWQHTAAHTDSRVPAVHGSTGGAPSAGAMASPALAWSADKYSIFNTDASGSHDSSGEGNEDDDDGNSSSGE